jgi:glucose uptake protein GlcU
VEKMTPLQRSYWISLLSITSIAVFETIFIIWYLASQSKLAIVFGLILGIGALVIVMTGEAMASKQDERDKEIHYRARHYASAVLLFLVGSLVWFMIIITDGPMIRIEINKHLVFLVIIIFPQIFRLFVSALGLVLYKKMS